MNQAQKRNMKGTLKKFNKREHGVYDTKGKDAILAYLPRAFKDSKYKHIENPNEHGIDVLTLNEDNQVVACWEVEVRHGNWRGNRPFPFGEINCIERKDHQWRKAETFTSKIPFEFADEYKVYYVQMNKECTRAAIIKGDTVLKYPLKPWRNRKASGEYVRQVPISEVTQVIL
tara:strand:+ start:165 stop:683 length:519 start_codon:yes stop_codon:yes gene_type:complete